MQRFLFFGLKLSYQYSVSPFLYEKFTEEQCVHVYLYTYKHKCYMYSNL